jgi:hypothetical protein
VLLALAGAACAVPGAAAAQPSPSPDPYKQALAFSQCMRAHGVPDFPDPHSTSGGGVGIQINGNSSTLDPSSSVFQAAQTACKKYSPANGPNGKGPSAKDRQAMLAFAACMRTHGVPDFPDPSAGGNGFSSTSGSGNEPPADMRPDSPQFQAAFQACKSKLPAGGNLSTSGGGK